MMSTNTQESSESQIEELLLSILGTSDVSGLRGCSNLFDLGLDSFGFVELAAGLEKKFRIQFSEEELMSEAFFSLEGISKLVKEKQKNV